MNSYPVNATDPCDPCRVPPCSAPNSLLTPREVSAHCAPANRIKIGHTGLIENNDSLVSVAMTEKRIRIGCTEITAEAARLIMETHALRFPKPPEYVMQ